MIFDFVYCNKVSRSRAFSLVEVVVAVGIFALAVVTVIGLLVPITQSVADVRDTDDATRVVSTIQAELQRLPFLGAQSIQNALKFASDVAADDSNATYDPSADNSILFASRGGDKVGFYNASSVWDPDSSLSSTEEDALKFFEIVLIRNEAISRPVDDNEAGYLAFTLRLRWPAFRPDGQRNTQNDQKNVLLVPMAITR